MNINRLYFIILNVFLSNSIFGYHNIPTVRNFDKTDYKGGTQNWAIGIDKNQIVYFGNNNGLLRNIFGVWQLNKTENKDIVRCVKIENDTIWCGGNIEYGYFVKQGSGDLKYHGCGKVFKDVVWNVEIVGNTVYFQAKNVIYCFDKHSKKVKEIRHPSGFTTIIKWENKLWLTTGDGSIGIVENGEFVSRSKIELSQDDEFRTLFVHNEKLWIVLYNGEIFTYDRKELNPIILPKQVSGKLLFTAGSYDDSHYYLGTISEGLFLIDSKNNRIITHVSTKYGKLIDNTVLSAISDVNGNIWLGLDYGISFIELDNSQTVIFNEGSTYSIKEFEGNTYLATNKGVLCSDRINPFVLVPNTDGQSWNLKIHNDKLYVCHNFGIFEIVDNSIKPFYVGLGVWDFEFFGDTPYFLFSTYNGVLFAEIIDGKINIIRKIEGDTSFKLKYDSKNECIWSKSDKNKIDQFLLTQDRVLSIKEHRGIESFFVGGKDDEDIIFYNDKNLLKFRHNLFEVIKEKPYDKISGNGITALNFDDNSNNVAYVQNGSLDFIVDLHDGNYYSYKHKLRYLNHSFISKFGYIDVFENTVKIATERGVVIFDAKQEGSYSLFQPVVPKIVVKGQKTKDFFFPYSKGNLNLSAELKDIQFHFRTLEFTKDLVEYRFRLTPYEKEWSDWSCTIQSKEYTQLTGGKYKFVLQGRFNAGDVHESTIDFNIEKLWYQTLFTRILIIILFVVGSYKIVIFVLRRRLRREKEYYDRKMSKNQVALKNEQLMQFTEIISSKNQFLNDLKNDLLKMRNIKAQGWVVKIENEVDSEKKAFVFHKLFSEVHQDFISQLSESCLDLTSNDIRILSYVRLNLSNSEISSLMNISGQSLNTARYRLRKKLNLSHKTDLNKYIRDL